MAGGAARVLVDTSAWIDALRRDGDPAVRASVRTVTSEGTAVLCDMVLLELWNGRLSYGMRAPSLSRRVTVPATDLLIACFSAQAGLSLLHRDGHFDLIAGSTPVDSST